MPKKEPSEKELMQLLKADAKTLKRFRQIRAETMKEAKRIGAKKGKKPVVLGISGSARDELDMAQENSNSEALLEKCLAKCSALGAKTELIRLRKYDIKPCKACYSTVNTQCHFYCSCYPKGSKTGDDMSNTLYDKILGADAIIFATPVNNFKMSTFMSAFIDRCISLDGSLQPANPKAPKDKALNTKHMRFIELTANPEVPGSGMLRRFLGKVAGIIVTGHEEGAAMVIGSMFMTLNHFGMLFPPYGSVYAMASVCDATYKDKKKVLGSCFVEEVEELAENVLLATKLARKGCKCTDWKYDNSKN
jgi:multimeric flavodoxin WrbA